MIRINRYTENLSAIKAAFLSLSLSRKLLLTELLSLCSATMFSRLLVLAVIAVSVLATPVSTFPRMLNGLQHGKCLFYPCTDAGTCTNCMLRCFAFDPDDGEMILTPLTVHTEWTSRCPWSGWSMFHFHIVDNVDDQDTIQDIAERDFVSTGPHSGSAPHYVGLSIPSYLSACLSQWVTTSQD